MLVKFIKFAGLALAVAFIISVTASYFIQTSNADASMTDELNLLLDDVETLMADNDEELTRIRAEMDKEYLEKTRAFAEMIKLDPDILNNFDELCKICGDLGVDELHVTDENGVLWWGTVESYYGFDFSAGEQTAPFLEALNNKSFELAQDPQPNGTTGAYFQYIGVSRYDKTGIVQIGMRPERLEEALAKASPSNMLDSIKLSSDNRILVIDPDGKTIQGDSRHSLEDMKSDDAGFMSEGQGFSKLENESVFWVARIINGKLGVALVTQSKMYSARNQSLIIVAITNLLIFSILLLIIAALVSKQFAKPINSVSASLGEIGKGNLDIRVNVYTSKEFKDLSDGINSMIENIKSMFARSKNVNDMLKGVVSEIETNVSVVETTTEELFNESRSLSDS